MKMNDVAGVGNWNTAQFWEYNTRTGIRANRDPKSSASISPYATFSGNPIMYSDVKGDSVELIIGKPYKDAAGKEHPYGHAALRVYNAAEGYNMIYDFGRYGQVDWNQTTGEGILNVYTDGNSYLKSEMRDRSSVGYSTPTTVEQDKLIMLSFKKQTNAGSVYKGGAVPGGGGTAYKIDGYDIFDNNCLTKSCSGMDVVGLNWLGKENDPRDALKKMESSYVNKGLSRTEYNKGGAVKRTYDAPQRKPSDIKGFKYKQTLPPADNLINSSYRMQTGK